MPLQTCENENSNAEKLKIDQILRYMRQKKFQVFY